MFTLSFRMVGTRQKCRKTLVVWFFTAVLTDASSSSWRRMSCVCVSEDSKDTNRTTWDIDDTDNKKRERRYKHLRIFNINQFLSCLNRQKSSASTYFVITSMIWSLQIAFAFWQQSIWLSTVGRSRFRRLLLILVLREMRDSTDDDSSVIRPVRPSIHR